MAWPGKLLISLQAKPNFPPTTGPQVFGPKLVLIHVTGPQLFKVACEKCHATPIECSAIGLLTLCLTETHTELRTQRVDLLENNIHYIQNSTSPISFKFRSQIKIPSLVPFVPVGV